MIFIRVPSTTGFSVVSDEPVPTITSNLVLVGGDVGVEGARVGSGVVGALLGAAVGSIVGDVGALVGEGVGVAVL